MMDPLKTCGMLGHDFKACGKMNAGGRFVSGHDFSRANNVKNKLRS